MINRADVYSKIGMALISAQRVEFVSGELLKVLENFDGGGYRVTTIEFLEKSAKSQKTFKTLGAIFSLHKLNPKLIIEDELDSYLIKRNILAHEFWRRYLYSLSEQQKKEALDFCDDFGRHSQRVESFFKGLVYFLSLRYVTDRSQLSEEMQTWSVDFKYFTQSLNDKELH
ncbi:hypothetical protein MUK70_18990 [Dyadobacter chenwenxiniae]|nr:hypothetical protein [Dyadobacter chenwenxiniae]UON81149.1 hypothetical protein MUK70_18990 [Dyadobacter chenwenxiniae]